MADLESDMKKELSTDCQHQNFEPFQGRWLCQFCKEVFSAEDIEAIMIARRQGFKEEVEERQI